MTGIKKVHIALPSTRRGRTLARFSRYSGFPRWLCEALERNKK